MLPRIARAAAFAAVLASALAGGPGAAQEASESYEREARKDFNQGRFKQAAVKFERAAEAAADPTRQSRMHLQEAWSHFNARGVKDARDALNKAFLALPDLEVIPEFFSPEFLRIVDDVRAATRAAAPPPGVDIAETIRMSRERLKDGRLEEVVHDLTYNVPRDKLGREGAELLATALERQGKFAEAGKVRAAGLDARPPAAVATAPAPAPPPAATAPAAAPATPAAPHLPKPGPGVDYLAMARALLARGDTVNGQAAANRQLEIEPTSSEAYRLLGQAYLLRGDRGLAEAHLKQSLKYNERNEGTLLDLYEFALGDKDWTDSLAYLKRAAEVNPENREKIVMLGRKVRTEGDLDRAAEVYAAAAETLSKDAAILTEYAGVLLAANRVEAALEPLMKAVVARPESEIVHANLAAVARRRGLLKEAEREYGEALRYDPNYVPALVGLGTLEIQKQSPARGIEPLRKAVLLSPENVAAVVALARAQRLAGQSKDAAETLAKANGLEAPEIWNEAGVVALESGRVAEAVNAFEKAAEKAPDDALYRANRDRAAAAAKFLRDANASPMAGR
ncbi:MAG TPA: tetratricopeptide repeat protein [Thermoanaerobaculia bacterium]|nr:tetratricopeptide repeat protein [Thermoanaerobaculia bacterium]